MASYDKGDSPRERAGIQASKIVKERESDSRSHNNLDFLCYLRGLKKRFATQNDIISEFFLISLKRQEMSGPHFQGTGHMEDIEAPVPACEGADRREALCLIDHIREIRGSDNQSALSNRGLESSPIHRRCPRGDGFAKFRKPHRVPELKEQMAR